MEGDSMIGYPEFSASVEVMQDTKISKKLIIWMIVIFVSLPILGLLVASVWTYMMPELYMSKAKIELVPSGRDVDKWGIDQYVHTEIEAIKSKGTMQIVSEKIQLEQRWQMDEVMILQVLQRNLAIKRVDGSRILKLSFTHRSREDAQAVCKAFYEAYEHRKAELYFGSRTKQTSLLRESGNGLVSLANKIEELNLELAHASGTYDGGLEWIGELRKVDVIKNELDEVLAKKKQLDTQVKEYNSIIVHDSPEMSFSPVSPNIPLNQSIGLISGLAAAVVIDLILLACLIGEKKKFSA